MKVGNIVYGVSSLKASIGEDIWGELTKLFISDHALSFKQQHRNITFIGILTQLMHNSFLVCVWLISFLFDAMSLLPAV